MAGAIAEIARETLAKDFRHIDPIDARVILVEGEERVLSSFPEDLSAQRAETVTGSGRRGDTGVHAKNLTENGLEVEGEIIPCRVKIWAAGNTASSVGKTLGLPVDRVGRVIVQDDLTIPGHPEVQVIGDLAHFASTKRASRSRGFAGGDPAGPPRRAQHSCDGRWPRSRSRFYYWDKGSMATIGRNRAVADLNVIHFSGFPAWLAWLFIHVLFLVGFRNRIAVLLQWAWAYVTFNKGARLITRNFQAEQRPPA